MSNFQMQKGKSLTEWWKMILSERKRGYKKTQKNPKLPWSTQENGKKVG